ncbi:hypothetical protein Cni_G02500 [Canna indica]|uniref:Homeobox domain-containing protein n=1 Tax=Canna indica TaxID=4628 RepID=A0AAQ3JPB9_9LILI|nr:hypothetical protein Cni_G02500 [Canna indica]
MTSPAADRFMGGGAGGEEQLLVHHPQLYYHVPQHSRREKLRFAAEESPQPTSLLLLHDAAPPLYPTNSLTPVLPSSSSSSFQLDGHGRVPIPAPQPRHCQIPGQGFSLSLSSTRPPTSRPQLASRPAPLGPFTGYAAVLSRSRFLEPARKLLEEVCGRVGYQAAGSSSSREMLLDADPARESPVDHCGEGSISGTEQQWKKTRLISMLDEVYRKYKQYYQQLQAVITSFESVAGLSNAAPFASMALEAMSKHFRCLKNILKNIISGQLIRQATSINQEDIPTFGLVNGNSYLQRTSNNSGTQPHVWRPQRGLPERAVSVLRAWLFEHFLHPYPTDLDKQNLAKQTGLTRNQVSNWFINARVRLWKPMVEEVHTLDMRKRNKTSASDDQLQPLSSSKTGNPLDCHQQFQVMAGARSSQYVATKDTQEQAHFVYNDASNHQHVSGGVGATMGGNSGVSLTLGLHQNNGVCFSEPLDPLNVVRRFGLEECNEGYLVSTFGGQERQFVKDDSSRLLHDFVG